MKDVFIYIADILVSISSVQDGRTELKTDAPIILRNYHSLISIAEYPSLRTYFYQNPSIPREYLERSTHFRASTSYPHYPSQK